MAALLQSAPLVATTAEHHQALGSLEEAATLFSDPDPALRSSGEAVFIQLRQSSAAVEHALYALEQSLDPFVHFQCLSVLLEKLPSLGLSAPSASLPSLTVLRDFLFRLVNANSQHSSKWPNYTRSRALQAFAAVQIRLLGTELEERRLSGQAGEVVEAHSRFFIEHVVQLIALPDLTASDAQGQLSRFTTGIGLAAALLDEIASAKSLVSYSGAGRSGGKNAQAGIRLVDQINLSPLQLRWVKSWMQEQILPPLLQHVVHCLSPILMQQQQESLSDNLVPLLSALVNISEKVLRWRPIASEPWAGLSGGPLGFNETALLMSEDEFSSNGYDEDDDDSVGADDDVVTAKRSTPATKMRVVPEALAGAFLSLDMIALMASAYRLASQFDTLYNREAAMCLTKLRRCILTIASFSEVPDVVHTDRVRADRQKALLETLKTLQNDASLASSRLLTDRGAGLLFLVQSYSIVFDSGSLVAANEGGYAIESAVHDLAALTNDVLSFAFSRRVDSDEEEDVALLADEAVSSIFYAWLALGQARDLYGSGLQVHSTYFSTIIKPFIDARLHAAAAGSTDQGYEEEEEELGEEAQSDQEVYEDTLVLFASLARDGDLAACLLHLQMWSNNVLHELTPFYSTASNGAVHVGPAELKVLERQWETLHWLLLIAGHILSDSSHGEVAEVPNEVAALRHQDQQVVSQLVRSLGVGLLQLFADAGADKPQSPQVMQTLLWFNARLVPTYMLTASTAVLDAELNNEQGKQLLAHLVTLVEKTTGSWLADADVIAQVSAVLRAFALSDGVMGVLLSMPQFTALVKAIVDGLGMLPAKTHNRLVSALVGCVYASASTQAPQNFFERITSAIEQRLSAVVHQPNFTSPSVFQRAETIDALMNVLDMFDGLAASAQPRSARAVFAFLSRFFDTLIDLAHMYKDRSEVGTAIVRIIRTLVGALDLGFGVDDETTQRLNDVVWRLLDGMPASVLLGDSGNAALEDETPFDGLCLTLDMLNDLLLSSDADKSSSLNEWLAPVSHRQTADVCLLGFARLVPVLQERDVLSVPHVRKLLARLSSRLLLAFGCRLVGLVVHESISTAAAAMQAGSDNCGRLYAACVQALALSLDFDEMGAVIDGLDGCDALTRAVKQVLTLAIPALSTADQSQRDALCVASRTLLASLLSPLYETVLRMLLFEPLATSMLDALLNTHHQLVDTIGLASDMAWQAEGGGQHHIQQHLDNFCASTPLVSLRTSTTAAWKTAAPSPDEAHRRVVLSQIISQLSKLGARVHSQQNPPDAKSKRVLQSRAREVAWNGRSEVRLR